MIQLTSKKDQQQYWADDNKPYRFVPVSEFAEAFKLFHIGNRLTAELAIPFDKTENHRAALTTKEYGVSKKELLKACASRELLLMRRNSFLYIFKLFQVSIYISISLCLCCFLVINNNLSYLPLDCCDGYHIHDTLPSH